MKTLNFYTVEERTPKNGETVFIIGEIMSYGSSYMDPKFAKVEYTWVVIDKDGDTGNQVCFEEGVECPEDCRLAMCTGGYELEPKQLYATDEDIDVLFEETYEDA